MPRTHHHELSPPRLLTHLLGTSPIPQGRLREYADELRRQADGSLLQELVEAKVGGGGRGEASLGIEAPRLWGLGLDLPT